MKRSMATIFLPLTIILVCLSPVYYSFSFPKQPLLQSATRALQCNGMDLTSIQKSVAHSIVFFGVALTALSLPSTAVELPLTYLSDDKSITFQHTADLQFSPKPLKTHDKEILFKSESIKGFNAGVTVRSFLLSKIMCQSPFHLFDLHPRRISHNHIL